MPGLDPSFSAKKPVSAWNKPLKADFKGLFGALSKGALHGFTGQWTELGGDSVDLLASLGIDSRDAPQLSWLLIRRALLSAMADLVREELWGFVVYEVRRKGADRVANWQKLLCGLISTMLRVGMPMEFLSPRPAYNEESRQARNAEEAMLAVLNACAQETKQLSKIEWPIGEGEAGTTSAGGWIGRLRGQRCGPENGLTLHCLSWLDLSDCVLYLGDLYGANLLSANLARASLSRTILEAANLEKANLHKANLFGANLQRANLEEANLEYATLKKASLKETNLQGARVEGARIDSTDLQHILGIPIGQPVVEEIG